MKKLTRHEKEYKRIRTVRKFLRDRGLEICAPGARKIANSTCMDWKTYMRCHRDDAAMAWWMRVTSQVRNFQNKGTHYHEWNDRSNRYDKLTEKFANKSEPLSLDAPWPFKRRPSWK